MYDIKTKGFPEGKLLFPLPKSKIEKWNDINNVKIFLNNLSEKLNLKTYNDWNLLSKKQLYAHGGRNLCKKYSLIELKSIGYPNGNFELNKKFKKPAIIWHDEKIQNFIDNLREKFNLRTFDDWNSILQKDIIHLGGRRLLTLYSMYDIKCMGFPDGKFEFSKKKVNSNQKPLGYWNKQENIDLFLKNIQEKLKLNTLEDWNSITVKEIELFGGKRLFHKYSIFDLKAMGFPDGKLKFDKPNKPPGYWDKSENVQNFLLEIKEKLNFKTPNDWNQLSTNHIISNGGSSLFNCFSIFDLKCLGCPEGKEFFTEKPQIYWKNRNNIEDLIKKLRENLNLNTVDDWNSITKKHVLQFAGNSLFQVYSLYDIKCMGFPDGKSVFSLPYKPSTFWDNQDNVQNFINELKKKFNIKTPEDWNRISKSQIVNFGGYGLLAKYPKSSLKNINLPEFTNNFLGRRSSQRWLFLQVQKLFPGEEIVEDYFHDELTRKSGSPVQFDVYLSQSKIAFEYHGAQHYIDIPQISSIHLHQYRDNEKEKLCKEFGIQLIVIPYWWDNSLESLQKTIESLPFSNTIINTNENKR